MPPQRTKSKGHNFDATETKDTFIIPIEKSIKNITKKIITNAGTK